jgi:hypothetical protein
VSVTEAFDNLQEQLSRTDKNLWLGQLVWYSVSGVLIHHNDLVKALVANNLGGYIPRLPSDVDVFRRVCTKAQKKRMPRGNAGYDNYLLRDIPMDGQLVHKVLVRETVEANNLSYETQLCRISFHKGQGILSHTTVPSTEVVAQQIVSDIVADFAAEQGSLNSHAVRELIRKMLLNSHAVNMRGDGGGLYFVPREESNFFNHLEGFAAMMPGNVEMGSHPVLDDTKRRDLLRRAFLTEVDEEVDRVVIEVSQLLEKSQKISSARAEGYYRQFTAAQEKVKEYDDLLEVRHDTAHSALSIFQRQLVSLLTLVEVPDA